MYKTGKKIRKDELSDGDMYYPHLDFDSDQFPEIKNMKVGKKYKMVIEVKPTRMSISEREDEKGNEKRQSMCMEVLSAGMKEKKLSGEEKTDKMIEKMYPKKEDK